MDRSKFHRHSGFFENLERVGQLTKEKSGRFSGVTHLRMAGQHDENGLLFRSRNRSGEHKTEKKSEDRFHAGECPFTARLGQWESKPKVEVVLYETQKSFRL